MASRKQSSSPKRATARPAAKRAANKGARVAPQRKHQDATAAATRTATSEARAKTRAAPASGGKTAGAAALETYRRKRDFGRTPEPAAVVASSAGGNSYLIQKHAARRLHYDFRLELDGVLLSWAVPNGPSLDPADKRLAVRTEDHPLEYGGFEGVIPEGEYGGGTVMLWDRGTWQPVGDAREGLAKGNLKFVLNGERLRGHWVLVRMKRRANEKEGKENWLLIKERDEIAQPGRGKLLTEKALPSVVSGRSMDEIATQKRRVWSSGQGEVTGSEAATAKPKTRRARLAAALRSEAPRMVAGQPPQSQAGASSAASEQVLSQALHAAPRAALPDFVSPELCTLAEQPPTGTQWLHEIKFDGYRLQARLRGGKARLLTRKGLDWTKKFPAVAEALAALPAEGALIDGEVVVLDAQGVSNFSGLQQALSDGDDRSLLYYAFDLLHLDGRDLTGLPLIERKAALQTLLAALPPDGKIRYSAHVEARGEDFYAQACRMTLEGIVSKRGDAPYRSGRGRDWIKVKCTKRQEFVVGGWLASSAAGRDLRSLLVGFYQGERFVYAGKIGTGFDGRSGGDLAARLRKLARDDQPFAGKLPAEVRRGARWVEPKVVVEVEFGAWTADNVLRHAAFKGVREDKPPREISIERAIADPDNATPAKRTKLADPSQVKPSEAKSSEAKSSPAKPSPATARKPKINAPESGAAATAKDKPRGRVSAASAAAEYDGVRLTHPERVLWPDDGVTKRALAEYYEAVAERILPHIAGRPLSLVRCPDGAGGPCFFQRHMGQGLPDAVRPVKVRSEKQPYLAIADRAGLFSLVQFSTLEIHPWGARVEDPEHADRIVMDFDPHEDLPWVNVVAAALECRERLQRLGLTSFVKTTGGKGLHVVVPIAPRHAWDEVRGFAEALAKTMAADNTIYVTTMTKRARKGRIFIDYLRNAKTATAIAPYSTRARPGATVAMPLAWDDLQAKPSSKQFTVGTVPNLIAAQRDDPWADLPRVRQSLTAKAKKAVGMR